MKLKRILLLAVLALVQLPLAAQASSMDTDTFSCATPWPFWWRFDGPRGDIVARDWEIQQVGPGADHRG